MGVRMKYVLFNDTSHTNNPGCQGTVDCLRTLFADSGMTCLRSYPVGFGAQRFQGASSPALPEKSYSKLKCSRALFRRRPHLFTENALGWDYLPLPFDRPVWEAAARDLERDYRDLFSDGDAVVINGEGTIHHNYSGAVTLVAWARAAARCGLPVLTVNCTIQAMDPFLLDELFIASKIVAVREIRTFNDLAARGYRSIQASDALFAWPNSDLNSRAGESLFGRKRCIYSPGVLTAHNGMTESVVGMHIQKLLASGWSVSYLTVELEDEKFEPIARRAGASIYPLRRWTPGGLKSMLQEHDLVISGRYHIIIFAWLAGRPVVPMSSNSWKVEGLLESAGLAPSLVRFPGMSLEDHDLKGHIPDAEAIERLRTLAHRNVAGCS